MMKKIIGIYKITNPKGKVYIGQSNDMKHRQILYRNLACKGQIKLYNSLVKYGWENHKFEIIEECLSNQLDEKEKQYKTEYINQYGWNEALFLMLEDSKGGNKSSSTRQKMALSHAKVIRPVLVYDLKGNFISRFDSPTHANIILFPDFSENTGAIFSSCKQGKQKTHRGYIFQFEDDNKIEEVLEGLKNNVKIRQRKIFQYDLEGNFIKEYPNSYCAEKEFREQGIRLNSTDVRACCNGKQKTAKGFKWEYGDFLLDYIEDKNLDIIENSSKELNNIIEQFDTDNKLKSIPKQILKNIIKQYSGEIIPNYNEEIDFFFPKLNLGIKIHHLNYIINNNYRHMVLLQKKYISQNIKILQIYSDEIETKPDIVISRIKNELKLTSNTIYARKCTIKEITDIQLKNNFLNDNHIQGSDKSKIKLGLYYNNELVSLMTFSHPRINIGSTSNKFSSTNWELLRFCNKINYNVIGAASKLFTYFIKNYNPHIIHSFADNRWSSPLKNVYETIGFKYISTSKHGYYYTKDFTTRLHRFNFNKQRLKEMGCDISKTENEIMKELGYHRIWDCGVTRYEYINPFYK